MNINSNQDLLKFNFPGGFVPDQIEKKYKIILKNYKKPFPTILDYTNSNIMDVNLPGLTFPTVDQTKYKGKKRTFRGSDSPYDVYSKDLNINFKQVDFNINYFIMQDLMQYHYITSKSPFIDTFTVTTLDEERREVFKLYFREVVPNSLSDTRIGYQLKDSDIKIFTASFRYNYLDIEFIPYSSEEESLGELIEPYYDELNANDPDNQPGDSPVEDIENFYNEIKDDNA